MEDLFPSLLMPETGLVVSCHDAFARPLANLAAKVCLPAFAHLAVAAKSLVVSFSSGRSRGQQSSSHKERLELIMNHYSACTWWVFFLHFVCSRQARLGAVLFAQHRIKPDSME